VKQKSVLKLKPGKEVIIQRKNPWIFSGAILPSDHDISNGDVIEIHNHKGEFLAIGHYQNSSIMVRILAYVSREINSDYYKERLISALQIRRTLHLPREGTTAYRWVHGEGDVLPGLIIDRYSNAVVIEAHSAGMWKDRESIAKALLEIDANIETIYCKRPNIMQAKDSTATPDEFLYGNVEEGIIDENSHRFKVNWATGQKTGFFLDQRDSRSLLGTLVKDKSVTNLYSYSGGFSIYAINHGAADVTSVDSSATACELLKENLELNVSKGANHQTFCEDVKEYLKRDFTTDVMIVDPPAFAKNRKKRHKAVNAYKVLNTKALSKIKPGGWLMTFSCSKVVSPHLFENTIASAFIASGRRGQITHRLSQGADHPVLTTHPEDHYLKGLLIRIT
jgi:23S rRNA (cytosine1962-C5)-methyltransferase